MRFQDVSIEVDAARIGGPDENRFGIICRYQDVNNYYFFVISSDGYYGIGKVSNGVHALLGQEMMVHTPAIQAGIAPNHLRAICMGNSLAFFVNQQPVGIASDDEFADGDIGLIAGSFNDLGVDILFDNILVVKP